MFLADPPSSFHLHRQGGEPITVVDGSFDNALTLGVNAGFRVNDRWAIEALFSWIPTKLVSPTRTEDVDAYMYGITGLFYIPVSGRFHPFVGAGIGAETMNYAASRVETHTELMGNVVGGLYVAVTEMTGRTPLRGQGLLRPLRFGDAQRGRRVGERPDAHARLELPHPDRVGREGGGELPRVTKRGSGECL